MSERLPSAPSIRDPSAGITVRRHRGWPWWAPVLFFGATVLSTLLCGLLYHTNFTGQEGLSELIQQLPSRPWLLLYGLPYSLALLGILMAHEMGHYLTCRYYGIDATPPYLLPAPLALPMPPFLAPLLAGAAASGQWVFLLLNPFGTFGAVIRIRSPFHDRRQLFDVGVAGPLAGFAVLLPLLALAILLSGEFESIPEGGWVFGEPLLFQGATAVLRPDIEPSRLMLHPIGWAAWFGLLATSLNLLPIGQLDGGHIIYALFGPRAHFVISRLTVLGLVALSFLTWPPFLGYTLFGLLGLFLGRRHPPTFNDEERPQGFRWTLAGIALIVLGLSFIPVPIRIN